MSVLTSSFIPQCVCQKKRKLKRVVGPPDSDLPVAKEECKGQKETTDLVALDVRLRRIEKGRE